MNGSQGTNRNTGSEIRPDRSLGITRRTFLHKSLVAGTAGAAAYGWFPLINTIDLAFGAEAFKFAWLSDTHLYPKDVNTRFVEKTERAVKEIMAMEPAADFLIFGGDLAQLGDPVELDLGNEILKEVTIQKVFIPGSTTGTWTWAPSGSSSLASHRGASITKACVSSDSIP